ncbi:hypothetical protein [Arthrobacter sp. N1]|uniref:hypothetical protein n=1 Tax=Arthrobacter sp. N1 TaxID=619291 RepID=UPI003BB0BC08
MGHGAVGDGCKTALAGEFVDALRSGGDEGHYAKACEAEADDDREGTRDEEDCSHADEDGDAAESGDESLAIPVDQTVGKSSRRFFILA